MKPRPLFYFGLKRLCGLVTEDFKFRAAKRRVVAFDWGRTGRLWIYPTRKIRRWQA